MASQVVTTHTQPCVWMCAGLISYRLCSRDFDCEHCPLDAALRGESSSRGNVVAMLQHARNSDTVPGDRLYSAGHEWLQQSADEPDVWRVGIDAFAAAIIGSADSISFDGTRLLHQRGDTVCTIDAGVGQVYVGAPIAGRLVRTNDALQQSAAELVQDPYENGWLFEVGAHEPGLDDLSSPKEARARMHMDVRRFRRSVAFHLLADVTSRATSAVEPHELSDLRHVLVGDHYAELLRDFVY